MSDEPRPTLAALAIADPPERWAALGFAVEDDRLQLDGIEIRLGVSGEGITSWAVRGIAPVDEIDGLVTLPASAGIPTRAAHPNGVIALDHIVVATPEFDRTIGALTAAGMPPRRIREVGAGETMFRQGFRRLGPAILEIVEARAMPPGPARFWGLVAIVADLEALHERLGDDLLSEPKDAVQPGRQIASLRKPAGLSPRVAFMTPENAV